MVFWIVPGHGFIHVIFAEPANTPQLIPSALKHLPGRLR